MSTAIAIIDRMIREHKSAAEDCYQELDSPERGYGHDMVVSALTELKQALQKEDSAEIDINELIFIV